MKLSNTGVFQLLVQFQLFGSH